MPPGPTPGRVGARVREGFTRPEASGSDRRSIELVRGKRSEGMRRVPMPSLSRCGSAPGRRPRGSHSGSSEGIHRARSFRWRSGTGRSIVRACPHGIERCVSPPAVDRERRPQRVAPDRPLCTRARLPSERARVPSSRPLPRREEFPLVSRFGAPDAVCGPARGGANAESALGTSRSRTCVRSGPIAARSSPAECARVVPHPLHSLAVDPHRSLGVRRNTWRRGRGASAPAAEAGAEGEEGEDEASPILGVPIPKCQGFRSPRG